ncbi:predicted DsbA family dithiol-disulfide isomerase [Rhodobacter sp. JA431]|uniref:DsbA family oxidoreductase n=1 Tax=Rhodobacter sp. JA431 TaxID=570013 RepID=UPI000BD001D5|nr:DsbA family oxidoreductase [Rhodobacter sp. JA431]SOB98187.1 predicted DsbA family dithiol-disulfide isomerase [Rhodobacter sp. JA431]
MITLDIFADPTCPFCYLGKTYLDRALETRPNHPFAIEWHPFQINPSLPPEGMDRGAWLIARFGPAEAKRVDVPIIEAAQATGVAMNLPAITRMPNTRDAQRLLHWAGIEGRQSPVMAALMRAYWREGRDIGAPEVLADIATQAGLDGSLIARLLDSEADADTVASREAHARERGITAVPSFIIANQHVVTGAQSTEFWQNVIDEISAA